MSEAPLPTLAEVRERAIKLLARREHAPAELAQKLRKRSYPSDLIDTALAELIEQNLLSSTRYAEALVRNRIEKGYGPLRLRDELGGKQIEQNIIDAALHNAEVDWFELAAGVRSKRFGTKLPATFPDKAKQMRFLQQRGFAGEQIQAAFTIYPQ